jgi:hypothetical protein
MESLLLLLEHLLALAGDLHRCCMLLERQWSSVLAGLIDLRNSDKNSETAPWLARVICR